WKIRPPGFINLQILPQLRYNNVLGLNMPALGILQALADGTKLLFKEDLLPSRGDVRL
ncbi:unnamed protein product, partial [Musa acuminata subsp. burmannicoides]